MSITSDSKESFWLNHIQQAKNQELSLAAYAKQNNLSDKSIYRWKNVLTQRGLLAVDKPNALFAKIRQTPETTASRSPVEILLANGHRIHLSSADQATLIALISLLRND